MATVPYHHGDLAAALVRTATEQARHAGPDGVVLREAARTVGVSHNAAYRHFRDRDALLSEVAAATLEEMAEAMRRALEEADASGSKDPAEVAIRRLRALGRTYVEFAVSEPGLFRTAFRRIVEEEDLQSAAPFVLLAQALEGLVAAGVVDLDDFEGTMMLCWSSVHGMSMLLLEGPLQSLPKPERDRALEAMLDQVEAGLRA